MAFTPRSLVPTVKSHMKPSKCFTERTIVRTHRIVFSSETAVLFIEHAHHTFLSANLCHHWLLLVQDIADFSIDAGTFYACVSIHVHADWSKLAPLRSALPFIRRAHIRFRLYHLLHGQFMSRPDPPSLTTLRANIIQISKMLAKARCLQSLKLVWTETITPPACKQNWYSRHPMSNVSKSNIDMVTQPLTTIQPSCTVIKGDVVVRNMEQVIDDLPPFAHPTDMEKAFSSAIDELIATRALCGQ